MKELKILITGANGFVGRNLTEYLNPKYSVFAASHKDLELLNEDSVSDFIEKNKINYIIHCANTGGSRKTAYDQNSCDVTSKNLRMFFNLVRCLTPDMKMLYFGSGAEYDKSRPLVNTNENEFDKRVPQDDYGFSKYLMSKYAEKTSNITNLRIFGLYGKYEDYTYKFISNAIVKNLLGMNIEINQNVFFSYLFIDDFLQIVEKIILNNPNERTLNIAPSEKIDLVSIAEIINEVGEFESRIIIKNDGLNIEYTADNSKLLENIGEYDFTPYEIGIKKLYTYYKKNMHKLDTQAVRKDELAKYCKINPSL